jgi:hypothetical protein
MRIARVAVSWLLLLSSGLLAHGADSTRTQPVATNPAASFAQVVMRVVEREHFFNAQIHGFHPLVETYIQNLKDDMELGAVPTSDQYFLGRLDLSRGLKDRSFMGGEGLARRIVSKISGLYSIRFLPSGFAQMVILDDDFQQKNYDFTFVRREFLGDLRCLAIDVQPKKRAGNGRFVGRIWVEDQDYNIVRFNGTYSSGSRYNSTAYLHFDSWRLNLRPGVWLPAYVYSEETGMHYGVGQELHFKAQTRLWGYDQQHLGHNTEFTQIVVDSPESISDQSGAAQDATPVEGERLWERQAEDNALERLQKIGLIAPEGEVDKVMQTVVTNLIVTNNLEIVPEVRSRVLLTSPLESFTIGHTIVISRGLIDVLPDEASLAMVLSHELAHIALGHRFDTKLAFNDRMFFADENTFQAVDFSHTPAEEEAADRKAEQLLSNSPYKDKLATAGLFLKALQLRAPELKSLIRPHLGNGLFSAQALRMSALVDSSPELDVKRKDQIAALPLGGRVKLDPWSDRIELIKAKPEALLSAREKMPFEVTPFFPHLSRISSADRERVAAQTGSTEPSNSPPAPTAK